MTEQFLKDRADESRAQLAQAMISHLDKCHKFIEVLNKDGSVSDLRIPTTAELNSALARYKEDMALYKYEGAE